LLFPRHVRSPKPLRSSNSTGFTVEHQSCTSFFDSQAELRRPLPPSQAGAMQARELGIRARFSDTAVFAEFFSKPGKPLWKPCFAGEIDTTGTCVGLAACKEDAALGVASPDARLVLQYRAVLMTRRSQRRPMVLALFRLDGGKALVSRSRQTRASDADGA